MPAGDGRLARFGEGARGFGAAVERIVIVVLSPLIIVLIIPTATIRQLVVRRRYLRFAQDVLFVQGITVSRRFRGDGLFVPFTLTGAALRKGSWQEVLRVVSDDIERLGYRRFPPDRPKADQRRGLQFSPPTGRKLPSLTLSLHLPGEVIEATGTVVPAGHVGVGFSLA